MDNSYELKHYYPVAGSYSHTAQNVIATLRRHTIHRDWPAGDAFISTLDEILLLDLDVAQACTTFYFTHGFVGQAQQLLEKIQVKKIVGDDVDLLDERVALLALTSAQADFFGSCSYMESLATYRKVEQIYVHGRVTTVECSEQPAYGAAIERIQKQNQLWLLDGPSAYQLRYPPLSDTRVSIETQMLLLSSVFYDNGFISAEELSTRRKTRVPPLVAYLQSTGRRYQEAILVFNNLSPNNSVGFISNTVEQVDYWRNYLASLQDDQEVTIKACALSRVAELLQSENPKAAKSYFQTSGDLHLESSSFGQLLSHDFAEFLMFPANWSSAVERFEFGSELCIKLCKHLDITKVSSSIRVTMNRATDHELWDRGKELVDYVQEHFKLAGNRHLQYTLHFVRLSKSAYRFSEAGETRKLFEDFLATPDAPCTPDLYYAACIGLQRAYCLQGNLRQTHTYAQKAFNSEYSQLNERARSEAAGNLADCQERLANAKWESPLGLRSDVPGHAQRLIVEVEDVASFLEQWIEKDLIADRKVLCRRKIASMSALYLNLYKHSSENKYLERGAYWLNFQVSKNDTDQTLTGIAVLGHVQILYHRKKYRESVQYAVQKLRDGTQNPDLHPSRLSLLRFCVVIAMEVEIGHSNELSEETIRSLRQDQFNTLIEHIEALKFRCDPTGLMGMTRHFSQSVQHCIKLWPERREDYLKSIREFFLDADEMYQQMQRGSELETGLKKWLGRRSLQGKYAIRVLYQYAGEFYLHIGHEAEGWLWVQNGRSKALLDAIHERETATERLILTLELDGHTKQLLEDEEKLIAKMHQSSLLEIRLARKKLHEHRDKMKRLPALKELLESSTARKAVWHNAMDDVWRFFQQFTQSRNIVVIDWFITARGNIWRLSVNYEERIRPPRTSKLNIKEKHIHSWATAHLKFPIGKSSPLERYDKALHWLRDLVDGVESVCKPHDLIVLTPPAALKGIPIHAIPFDGRPGTVMIDRNPVIYCSNVNLFRECLHRAESSVTSPVSSPLENALFTAAFEEAGFAQESHHVISTVKSTAAKFAARTCTGENLTRDSLVQAFTTASWIHYHGHAYYAKDEALDQCFVLSGLSQEEQLRQTRDSLEVASVMSAMEDMQLTTSPEQSNETILSAHLLRNSTRLTVSEIFAMNLTKTHPVVCSIACDSGVQDISAGDEPLGLVSALFCAGASSVIGTLWPICSSTGRLFTEAFYENLHVQAEEQKDKRVAGQKRVLDLALALRAATLEVKKVKSDPYSWAAFVLQGAGFLFYE